jgi:hypothetical protein
VVLRDLKRFHNYSIPEQEEMLPFERELLLDQIYRETLKDKDVPEQGWSKYAEELGATKKTKYTDKYKVLDH